MLIVSKLLDRVGQVNRESFHFLCVPEGGEAYRQNKSPGLFPSRDMKRLGSCGIRGKDPQHKKCKLLTDQQEGLKINEDCVGL